MIKRQLSLISSLSLSFTLFISLLFFSCNNSVNFNSSLEKEKQFGRLRFSIETSSRQIFTPSFSEDHRNLTCHLKCVFNNDSSITKEFNWTDTTDDNGNIITALQSFKSDYSLSLAYGEWQFTLSIRNASNENLFVSNLTQNISSQINTLYFKLQEATDNPAKGTFEFILKFPSGSFSSIESTLAPFSDNSNVLNTITNNIDAENNSTNFIFTNLPSGIYILTCKLKQIQEYSDHTSSESIIGTYMCLVKVANGLCTTAEEQIEDVSTLYSISYFDSEKDSNSEEYPSIESFSESVFPISFNKYTSFNLPTPIKEGYKFIGWFSQPECTNDSKISTETPFSISEDTSLYAKWAICLDANDISYGIRDDKETVYISTAEGLYSFKSIVSSLEQPTYIPPYNEDGNLTDEGGKIFETTTSINAMLLNDIDLTNQEEQWEPINMYINSTFDGNGKTISFVQTETSSFGLFNNLLGSTIQNLTIVANIENSTSSYCGGFANFITNSSNIVNCIANITLKNNNELDSCSFGAFVGFSNNSTISNCISIGELNNIETATQSFCAGIVGNSETSQISNCINFATINSTSAFTTGITYGSSENTSITNCLNVGNMSRADYPLSNISTSNCYFNNSIIQSENENGKDTYALITASTYDESWTEKNWSFADNRYPLPNIFNDQIPDYILQLATPQSVQYVTTLSELESALESTDIATIIIENDITIDKSLLIERDVTILANSDVTIYHKKHSSSGEMYMFRISAPETTPITFTLGGGQGVLSITEDSDTPDTAAIGINSANHTVNIENNIKFYDFVIQTIYCSADSTININGGEFTSNSNYIIRLYLGTVNLNSGSIHDNHYAETAETIYIAKNCTANIPETSTISIYENYDASGNSGSLIQLPSNDSTFNIRGTLETSTTLYTTPIKNGIPEE